MANTSKRNAPAAVGQPAAIVVPSDHDVAEAVDGRRGKQLEAVGRTFGHGGRGPGEAVVAGARDDDVGVVAGAVGVIGVVTGNHVDVVQSHGVGNYPRLAEPTVQNWVPGMLPAGWRLNVMSASPGVNARVFWGKVTPPASVERSTKTCPLVPLGF